ncbi:MAG: hypothetical protein WD490_01870 [Opitutales bacterium]
MNPTDHPLRHKWIFYNGKFWSLIAVSFLLVCAVSFRLFMVWPKINPKAKPTPRMITCTVWAGCVHDPDRTFEEIITWKDPGFTLYNFLGIRRRDDSLSPKEWGRFAQLYDPGGEHRLIDLKWIFWVPGEKQRDRSICDPCRETVDRYLLGKPPNVQVSHPSYGFGVFHAYKPKMYWNSGLRWWDGACQIFLLMSEDGMHGPYAVLPMLAINQTELAINQTEQGDLSLHFLMGPYGACTFMNEHTTPIQNLDEAIRLRQTFEKLMGWRFVDKVSGRMKEMIERDANVQQGQTPVVAADLEVVVMEDVSGWVFRGPVKISDATDDWLTDEIIYHRCELRVNRDGTIRFQHLKQLVERYPGYQ